VSQTKTQLIDGIVVDASGNVNIDSNTFYVDAANNRVGFGTTAPAGRLDVATGALGGGFIGGGDVNTATGRTDATRKYFAMGSYPYTNANSPTAILVVDNDGTNNLLHIGGNQAALNATTAITFFTAANNNTATGSERARIDSSGRLLVGTFASPAHQLQVSTDSAGKPSTNTWTIVSDQRIKEDIELANLDLCYEAIKNIPLKRFKWRDEVYTDEQVRDRRKLGWIAQDVEAVFPKAVGTYEFKYNQVFKETIIPAVEEELDADGNVITPAQPERIEKGELISEDVIEDCRDLNADQLYAAMYGAVQKLMAKVETLEASNADLIARLSALEAA